MPKVREKLARVYYDTAATPFLYDIQIFPIVGEILRYKILFGTDFPLVRPGPFIEQIKNSGLSQRGLERILGENAAKLLKIEAI
jgi:predicted TIM-barrel fold metal-dependent hydrolase